MFNIRLGIAGTSANDSLERFERARPIGDVIKISEKGSIDQKNHYESFHFKGTTYAIDETILLTPSSETMRPYVAIIKDISMKRNQGVMLSVQMFFRPKDVQRERSHNSSDARELFFSFHKTEAAAEAVMHRCVVHVLPEQYPLPPKRKYPGFIAQEVYDPYTNKLCKLDDKDFAHDMQREIDLLVQKTMRRLGIYPYVNNSGGYESDQEDQA